jgi:hypothetical protein
MPRTHVAVAVTDLVTHRAGRPRPRRPVPRTRGHCHCEPATITATGLSTLSDVAKHLRLGHDPAGGPDGLPAGRGRIAVARTPGNALRSVCGVAIPTCVSAARTPSVVRLGVLVDGKCCRFFTGIVESFVDLLLSPSASFSASLNRSLTHDQCPAFVRGYTRPVCVRRGPSQVPPASVTSVRARQVGSVPRTVFPAVSISRFRRPGTGRRS